MDRGGGGRLEGEGGASWTPHPPLEKIPDNDWIGETWGLFYSDLAIEDLQEDPEQHMTNHNPHSEDLTSLRVEVTSPPQIFHCPDLQLSSPSPPPPPPSPPPSNNQTFSSAPSTPSLSPPQL